MAQKCTACGLDKSEWKGNGGKGVEQNGARYCCDGCANGTGCTC